MSYTAIIKLPFSTLAIHTCNEMLQAIDFLPDETALLAPQSPLAREVSAQLAAFCRDKQFCFDLPLAEAATSYQQSVREALLAIPAGQVMSYSELADQLASGARAVAMACRHNPLPVVVPCHRIVAKQGMGGYAGAIHGKPVEIKRWLLEHECAGRF